MEGRPSSERPIRVRVWSVPSAESRLKPGAIAHNNEQPLGEPRFSPGQTP